MGQPILQIDLDSLETFASIIANRIRIKIFVFQGAILLLLFSRSRRPDCAWALAYDRDGVWIVSQLSIRI